MARILIVDDEEPIRLLLRQALTMEGHDVIEACHGAEALRLHRATPAELIITDIVMPEKDGLEVIMALRRESPKVKVIATSGGGRFHLMESLEMAGLLGAVAMIPKPFDPEEMLGAVRRALAA
jgi:two-component system, chemotaxis family, chemotaxis protein CheY